LVVVVVAVAVWVAVWVWVAVDLDTAIIGINETAPRSRYSVNSILARVIVDDAR
jgi:hypothetical protein